MPAEAREIAGATIREVLRYVQESAGDVAVSLVRSLAGLVHPSGAVQDGRPWYSYEHRVAVLDAAARVLGDAGATRRIGHAAAVHAIPAGKRAVLRFRSPDRALREVVRVADRGSKVATVTVLAATAARAMVTYELLDGKDPHRLDCLYVEGLLGATGELAGSACAVEHAQCAAGGAPRCVFVVRWSPR